MRTLALSEVNPQEVDRVMRLLPIAALAAAAAVSGSAVAEVRLPRIFGDGMVLQQQAPVPVWGWAKEGERVTVSFAGQKKEAVAGADGKWTLRLDAMSASKESREMIVAGGNTITFKDVVVGEVWLCSGQSNMDRQVAYCLNYETEKAFAKTPHIRECRIMPAHSERPLDDVTARWVVCSPETFGGYYATSYYFAREVAAGLDVPVGVLADAWGASYIEPWTSPEGFRMVPELKELSQAVDAGGPFKVVPRGKAPTRPVCIFNGMIAPIIPFGIRGAIWYQGEANAQDGIDYLYKMQALIGGWRLLWKQGDFPFYYVQLASFQLSNPNAPAGGDGWARIREVQAMALRIPNTGMACAIDLGEAADIHPKNKQDVGKRLALWALAKTYGKQALVFSGPMYKSHAVEGASVRISFDHAGGGLMLGRKKGLDPVTALADARLQWIAVAGEDKVWHWADAAIDGVTLLVSSPRVPKPVAVRYAYTANPEGVLLYNKEGLPALPFRTDSW